MIAMTGGRIILEDREVTGKALLFDEKIRGLCGEEEVSTLADEVLDVGGAWISPGLIDVHIHGFRGDDVSDADPDGIRRMAGALLGNGVTSFLPTTMTVGWGILEKVFAILRPMMAESGEKDFRGARILGCHAEGPFINPARKGAQAEENILPPDAEKILPWKDVIRMITYAPEIPGGIEFTRALREKSGIVLSVGHTAADFDTAMAAVHAGAEHFTHTFNAMTPMSHRSPGVVGAALYSDAWCEMIADAFHVDKALFSIVYRVKGDRLCLITDCLRAGGLRDGEYFLGGQAFDLKGIECRLKDGTIAGSVLTMNKAVRLFREHAGVSMWEAVRAASLSPARSIHEDGRRGSLSVGKDADITVFDDDLNVRETWVGGVRKYIS
ncbi:MAG: N-acetylglucosamine-6-phosphate deacetylase [Clostridia bacterium]|nr:N-acetylglucosamine-6-phosphate deacetylase [Clostridia bacterium]